MAYRFSTLLVVAGCYPIEGFVITGAKVINYLRINQIIILKIRINKKNAIKTDSVNI